VINCQQHLNGRSHSLFPGCTHQINPRAQLLPPLFFIPQSNSQPDSAISIKSANSNTSRSDSISQHFNQTFALGGEVAHNDTDCHIGVTVSPATAARTAVCFMRLRSASVTLAFATYIEISGHEAFVKLVLRF
jgi:hypothetical protein